MKTFNKKSKKYYLVGLSEIEIYQLLLSEELSRFPRHFWNHSDSDEFTPKIVRYLIENILKWTDEDIKKNLRKKTFEDHKLRGMLYIKYDDSPYQAITKAYPEKDYKPWDFVNTPNNYWQGESGKANAIEAIKWLIEDKLNWNNDDIKNKLSHQIFTDNNLLGMIKRAFNSDLFEAIDYVYPGIFKRWEIGEHVKNDYWDVEKGIEATKWLIEEKLQWKDSDIRKNFNKQIFVDNNLYGMIQRCFNSSPYVALNKAYPDRYKEWELPKVPCSFWNEESCYKAIKWLIEDELKIDKIEDIRKHLNKNMLIKNGLCIPMERYTIDGLVELYINHCK